MFYFIKNFKRQKLRLRKAKKLFYNADAEISKWPIKTCVCNTENKEAYSELCRVSKMELFVKIFGGGWHLAKFARSTILDV